MGVSTLIDLRKIAYRANSGGGDDGVTKGDLLVRDKKRKKKRR